MTTMEHQLLPASASSSTSAAWVTSKRQQTHQLLVRFNNTRTFVYNYYTNVDPTRTNENNMNGSSAANASLTSRMILQRVLEFTSLQTHWPVHALHVSWYDYPFVSIRVKSNLLGGKGGFGTLLKGQSKQAGAKTTTDFGACRDLQGRRLRHVNDEIKLRKWKELQELQQGQQRQDSSSSSSSHDVQSLVEQEMKIMQTPSGVLNWYLMVPHWASDSLTGKQASRMQRQWKHQLQGIHATQDSNKHRQMTREQLYQQSIEDYVTKGTTLSTQISNTISNAIQQGIQRKQQEQEQIRNQKDTNNNNKYNKKNLKRKLQDVTQKDDPTIVNVQASQQPQQPQSLSTLSGEVILEDGTSRSGALPPTNTTLSADKDKEQHASMQIQSKSDFCTVVLMLERINLSSSTTTTKPKNSKQQEEQQQQEENKQDNVIVHENNPSNDDDDDENVILYYEVQIITGGLAQIGWAAIFETTFQPNNDTGDGVGDDSSSYAYDGSRGLIFHNGIEQVYPSTANSNSETTKETQESSFSTTYSYWQPGDVIGCLYDMSLGEISFTRNGVNLGVAFTRTSNAAIANTPLPFKFSKRILVPAMSCNQNEILQLHVHSHEMKYLSSVTKCKNKKNTLVPVGELLTLQSQSSSLSLQSLDTKQEENPTTSKLSISNEICKEETTEKSLATSTVVAAAAATNTMPSTTTTLTASLALEPLNLDSFSSVEELEKLGMDRLKGASIAIGIKCGGSLQERAKRLFSLKGLNRTEYPQKIRAKNFVL